MITISKLRFELYNNSVTSPANLESASGQVMEMVHRPATKWSVAVHHPELMECACIRNFDSIKLRREWVAETISQE